MMIYSRRVQLYTCGKIALLKPTMRDWKGLSKAILLQAYNCTCRLYIIISYGKSLSGYEIEDFKCFEMFWICSESYNKYKNWSRDDHALVQTTKQFYL